uniref:Uncharacterized protein n=1 Tax=Parascaris equorum TaxID=6256 RepID=A0A914RPW5_PAREQ
MLSRRRGGRLSLRSGVGEWECDAAQSLYSCTTLRPTTGRRVSCLLDDVLLPSAVVTKG